MISVPRIIQQATGVVPSGPGELLQNLWSGYGTIKRYRLEGDARSSVIVKHISPPPRGNRGENRSHQRKQRSYEVEICWYQRWSSRCGKGSYVPECFAVLVEGEECLLVLEDLDASGFSKRRRHLSPVEMRPCLNWLANFHCTFLGQVPEGLWTQGSYWHLETRPDELQALADRELKSAAAAIDQKLSTAKFQTIIHGDAKLENFCFSEDGHTVAAVDFQYVGGGCGVKDVAYFIGSCLDEAECEIYAEDCLDYYLVELRRLLVEKQRVREADELCDEWRELFPFAWADFHRFYKGWSSGRWGQHSYSETVCRKVLAKLREQ